MAAGQPESAGRESVRLLISPVAAGRRSAPLEDDSKGRGSRYAVRDSQSGDLMLRNVELKLPR